MREKEINLGYIQITRKCNNYCAICSNPPLDKELSFKEIKNQINSYLKKGINTIILTGGEPTLSPLLIPSIQYCKKIKIDIRIITNGRRLKDKRLCKELRKSGLSKLNISFNSHINSIFEKITRTNGSYEETLEGIKNSLLYIGVPSINLVITSLNYTTLPETVQFVDKNYSQINHFSINFIDPTGRALKHKSVVPSYSEAELGINKLLTTLSSLKKTFRLERVPLCYMRNFECYSTETIRAITKQESSVFFLDERKFKSINFRSMEHEYRKKEGCDYCAVKDICVGVNKNYIKLYNQDEIYPFFGNKTRLGIIKEVINL